MVEAALTKTLILANEHPVRDDDFVDVRSDLRAVGDNYNVPTAPDEPWYAAFGLIPGENVVTFKDANDFRVKLREWCTANTTRDAQRIVDNLYTLKRRYNSWDSIANNAVATLLSAYNHGTARLPEEIQKVQKGGLQVEEERGEVPRQEEVGLPK